ncbi:MAG: BamA/TamA family outer membrane protein, partial [Verrucomicrobiota bacterium]
QTLALSVVLSGLGSAGLVSGEELVDIVGLQSLPTEMAEGWIETQLEFVESSGVTMARADDLAFFLENALRDRGYKSATVDWTLLGDGEAKRIRLQVDEGKTVTVGHIHTEGNEAVQDEAVAEVLLTATRKRLQLDEGDPTPFVANDIQSGEKRLLELYRLLGFRDASIDLTTELTGSAAIINVSIAEGVQKRVGDIRVAAAPDPVISEKVEPILADFVGKTYSAATAANLKTRFRELAVNSGYYNATVTVEEAEIATPIAQPVSTSSGGIGAVGAVAAAPLSGELPTRADSVAPIDSVDLVVNIDWGNPVVVNDIRVSGHEKVQDRFFDRHFSDIEGEPYRPSELNSEIEELLETGAFETIRTDIVEQPDGTAALEIEVEESYSRTLAVYGGYATYEGPIGGFEFKNLNLFGSVRTIDATIEASRRGARGEVGFTDPWFLWTDYEFNASIFALNRAEEGYDRFTTGGRYQLGRTLGEEKRTTLSLFGEASYTDVHDTEIDEALIGDRTYFANMVGVSFRHDRRDDPAKPRSGWIAQASAAVAADATGSEVEFFKATGGLGFYFPIKETTLRLRARAGIIRPIGDQGDIPIDLRFFNGGANSVRSFEERRLGTRDPASGFPVGGEFFSVASLEYDIPIEAINGLSVVPFADAGNLILDADDASLDDLRYAVGLGLHYNTPIGPLRVEYGINPDKRADEPDGVLHVGFGVAF